MNTYQNKTQSMSQIKERDRLDGAGTVLHWYDFICPFCYIGQQQNTILGRNGLRVAEMPFQAHPEIPPGGSFAGSRQGPMYAMLEHEAKDAGLALNWPPRLPNSRHALAAAEWVRQTAARPFRAIPGRSICGTFRTRRGSWKPDRYRSTCKRSGHRR